LSSSPFGSENIIKQNINGVDIRAYFVGFDIDDKGQREYRWKPLTEILLKVIHEFAFGFHEGDTTKNVETLPKIVEAARSIYKISEFQQVRQIYETGGFIDDSENTYLRRGEFGELILHLLLRDYHNTIPLLSKIYFKDAYGATVHGFDAVHVQPNTQSLWLGESKLYVEPKNGIKSLIQDIKVHVTHDYLESEFTLIARKVKLFGNIPEKESWLKLLEGSNKLSDQLNQIYIPLLCTYSCELFTYYDDEKNADFISDFQKEITKLKTYFDYKNDHPLRANMNIILLLFPVKCKKELVARLHKKLWMIQQVGD
jgi:hypothetical protein